MQSTSFTSYNRVAIVVDWLIDFGGAELVIKELLDMFPNAEIFTSVCFMNHPMLTGRIIHTSFIQKIPFFNQRHKLAGIFRPWAFRRFDLSEFDLIICSSSAESKNVACGKWRKKKSKKRISSSEQEQEVNEYFSEEIPSNSKNILKSDLTEDKNFSKVFVYCHTPIRYYWSHYDEYKNMLEFGKLNFLAKMFLPIMVNFLRKKDLEAAQAVDVFWANSETTAQRIKKYYHRHSEVIYPGIHTEEFYRQKSDEKQDFYFAIGRCIPYKKFDLLVEAFNKNGKPLKIATNTDNLLFSELKAKSKPNIEWIFAPSIEQRNRLYADAKAFLFPPEEDFGLVPVEAMASGTPVIAYGK